VVIFSDLGDFAETTFGLYCLDAPARGISCSRQRLGAIKPASEASLMMRDAGYPQEHQ
jgi:hypothetical protein